MTTVAQAEQAFEILYRQQCSLRKLPQQSLADGVFRLFFDLVWADMAHELNIQDTTQDITLTPVSVYTVYDLSENFGGLRDSEVIATDGSVLCTQLQLKNIDEVTTLGNLVSGTPNSISIIKKNGSNIYQAYLYPLTAFGGTLRIRFKYVPVIYAGASAVSVGDANLAIPNIFLDVLFDGIMAKLFPDMEAVYRDRLERKKSARAIPVKPTTNYELGGFDE